MDNIGYIYDDIESCEMIGEFNDEYVYDVEVDDAKETIVITEMLSDSTLSTSESVATKTTNFIHSVKDKMEGLGYKLISTDTNGVGEQGYKIFITLIFERK